jgi:hypothetical protein
VSLAEAQRTELAFSVLELRDQLRFVDLGFSLVQVIRQHPALSIASATLLLPVARNKLLLWGSKLFAAWELFTLVRRQWRNTG